MIVTTLPIAYRPNRSFKILFTPLVANFISKFCRLEIIYPIDLMGIRKPVKSKDRDEIIRLYKKQLFDLNVYQFDSIFSNTDHDFWKYVAGVIDQQISCGDCKFVTTEIIFCGCGKVELPNNVFQLIKSQERLKLVEFTKDKKWVCVDCKNELKIKTERVLVRNEINSNINWGVFPEIYNNIVKISTQEILSRPIMISRHHRSLENTISFKNNIAIDPDYCWAYFLNYLKRKTGENNFILIVGANTIPQACRTITLAKTLDPKIKIHMIIHPIINFNRFNQKYPGKLTVERMVEYCGSTEITKTLLASCIQWNSYYSVLNDEEIKVIQNSFKNRTLQNLYQKNISISQNYFDYLIPYLKKDNILMLLKKLRQNVKLSPIEQQLLKTIT